MNESLQAASLPSSRADELALPDLATTLVRQWRLLTVVPLVAGAIALGISYVISPVYTARTLFLPPQNQQQNAASALASISALAGLAGAAGVKTTGDQYVSLMQSINVSDRIINRFDLMTVYEAKFRDQARKRLEQDVHIALGKKDGLITVEADANSPKLAADMANQYVEELRRLTGELALTEAKQRRLFFEAELTRTKQRLTDAQLALQRSGFNAGALKVEPKAAAEAYARVRAEATATEVRLESLRRSLADNAPEIQQQSAALAALRSQLRRLEASETETRGDADYVGNYREFKYQEALFDIFSKQYELARMEESKDSSLIQVIDVATPPERKSKPKRLAMAVGTTLVAFVLLAVALLARQSWLRSRGETRPQT